MGKLERPAEDLLLDHIRVAWPDPGSYSSFTRRRPVKLENAPKT